MVAVIPAYQPDEKLLGVAESLLKQTDYAVLIVDDGSRESCQPIFAQLEGYDRITVLHHEVNKGKGAAMKTAFRYIQEHMPEEEGLITIDADGQHLTPDVIRVVNTFREHRDALVTGSRRFTGDVPFKSMAGNTITRGVFAISTGVRVYDTQTGLRAFATALIPQMLSLQGDRYEYEISQLLYCCRERIPIVEVPIETVYIEDNASSHFHPLRDGWKIYKIILSFASSSLLSFLFEYVVFLALSALIEDTLVGKLLISTVVSRVLSSILNYYLNQKMVFEQHNRTSFVKYVITAVLVYGLHYGLLYLSTFTIGIPRTIGYILVQLIVYPVSFYLQRKFVFIKEHKKVNAGK